jgi:hypothetical protein
MQPNDAGSVSAVPSGSAGEPTPTDAEVGARGEPHDAATTYPHSKAENGPIGARGALADSAASRLAALRQHPEVAKATAALFAACECVENARFCGSVSTAFDALLSAVAAAATREAEREFCLCLLPEGADTINRVTTRMLDRRALAGGAPPQREGTD